MIKKRTKNYQYVRFLVSEEGDNNSFLVFSSKDLQVTHILYNLRSIAKLSLKQLIHHRECLVKPVFFFFFFFFFFSYGFLFFFFFWGEGKNY